MSFEVTTTVLGLLRPVVGVAEPATGRLLASKRTYGVVAFGAWSSC